MVFVSSVCIGLGLNIQVTKSMKVAFHNFCGAYLHYWLRVHRVLVHVLPADDSNVCSRQYVMNYLLVLGPTDLSTKNKTSSPSPSLHTNHVGLSSAASLFRSQGGGAQLSGAEVLTMKSLIASYRESAAFLYRSAEELEQVLLAGGEGENATAGQC